MAFDVSKPKQKPIVLIRAASGHELSSYEKSKLANIEDNAQEKKLESVTINGQRLPITNKEVNINLGSLAFKQKISDEDLENDVFFIECELDDGGLLYER